MENFFKFLDGYFSNIGIWIDVGINVIFGGAVTEMMDPLGVHSQTVSTRVAVAARNGSKFACIFCRFLSVAVQRDHCADQFTNTPSPWWVYIRAGIAFALGGYLLYSLLDWLFHLVMSI